MKNNTHFFITSLSVLLIMKNVSGITSRENQNTHFTFNNVFFFENRAFYEKMWKNFVEGDRRHDDMESALCVLGTYGCKYTHSQVV